MTEVLEIALILLIITLIVMFIFATKLLIEVSKLVQNIDDASSKLKNELELTIKEINVAIKNVNKLTEKPSFKINILSKLLTSALSISTPTATLIPEKACCTIFESEKLSINPAIDIIIASDGNTTPLVANIAPNIPFSLYPINVAVFTAIIPGVA